MAAASVSPLPCAASPAAGPALSPGCFLLVGSSRSDVNLTFAGVLVGFTSEGPLVGLPLAAEEHWPGMKVENVLDSMDGSRMDVMLSQVPLAALVEYVEEDFTEEQLDDFWSQEAHVHFGTDVGGNHIWPDAAELQLPEGGAPRRGRARGGTRRLLAAAEEDLDGPPPDEGMAAAPTTPEAGAGRGRIPPQGGAPPASCREVAALVGPQCAEPLRRAALRP